MKANVQVFMHLYTKELYDFTVLKRLCFTAGKIKSLLTSHPVPFVAIQLALKRQLVAHPLRLEIRHRLLATARIAAIMF